MDPYSQNENLTNNINWHVYDTLVTRDTRPQDRAGPRDARGSRRAPPPGASSCDQGVKFHDGTPFTADDVVFSFQRASEDTSQIRAYAKASGKPRKIDDLTVEFVTEGPNPIELEHIVTIFIMTKSWSREEQGDEAARLQEQGGDDHRPAAPTAPARTS